MDIGTSVAGEGLVPNQVLFDLRASRKWGRPRLARELHNFCLLQGWPSPGEANLAKQIYRLETGRIRLPDDFYSQLYCRFFEKSSHELFGETRAARSESAAIYRIRSHKFVPVYVGHDAIERIQKSSDHVRAVDQWTDCHVAELGESTRLFTWPCGVAIFHIVEDLNPDGIACISIWRRETYPVNIEWAVRQLEEDYDCMALNEPYVLSVYWVHETPYGDARRDIALRLLSIPRVLTSRDHDGSLDGSPRAHAELVEQALLREGFDHAELHNFGIQGISAAYASWSGVVYHPTAPNRALTEAELVACELSVQATWAYCDFVRNEVEHGRDPVVPDVYGWRFLRGLRSRLTTERPQETSQHRAMRDAIVHTSGLVRRLEQALDTLKETSGRA